VTGNTSSFGTWAGNGLTVLQANLKPGMDLTCAFTNHRAATGLSLVKSGNSGTYTPGGSATYTLTAATPPARTRTTAQRSTTTFPPA